MKLPLIIGTLFLFSLSASALPASYPPTIITGTELPDISRDNDFIRTVNQVFAFQSRIVKTNSAVLLTKSVDGTISATEKRTLATNLGYADYASLNTALDNIGLSMLSLKSRYTELDEQAMAATVINTSIDRLINEGKITGLYHGGTPNPCLRDLYKDLFYCLKSAGDCVRLNVCLRAAYMKYTTCKTQTPPR